jgi:ribosomal protein S18 acetylase RimI-like enzyme
MQSVAVQDASDAGCAQRATVSIEIGTSKQARSPEFVCSLVALVNRAYGQHRLSEREAVARLHAGDERTRNRVLHCATRDGRLVGCCSSTTHTPWCGPGTGHWGLLAVDPEARGTGVASALVNAAERRLSEEGCYGCGIEYSYHKGDPLVSQTCRRPNLNFPKPVCLHPVHWR